MYGRQKGLLLVLFRGNVPPTLHAVDGGPSNSVGRKLKSPMMPQPYTFHSTQSPMKPRLVLVCGGGAAWPGVVRGSVNKSQAAYPKLADRQAAINIGRSVCEARILHKPKAPRAEKMDPPVHHQWYNIIVQPYRALFSNNQVIKSSNFVRRGNKEDKFFAALERECCNLQT